jgi:hypothetical protein
MKGVLALLLIAGGLYVIYEIINTGGSIVTGGGTPPTPQTPVQYAQPKTPDQVGTVNSQRLPGGAGSAQNVPFIPPPIVGPGETPKDPTTGQPVGGAMVSLQTRLSHLGTLLVIDPWDHFVRRGWN